VTFYSARARKPQMQLDNDRNTCRIRANSKFIEELQVRELSQASAEQGHPNQSAPHGQGEEGPHSQDQDLEESFGKEHRYIVEESRTYLARALEAFSKPLKRTSNLARSKSMPSNSQFQYLAEASQDEAIAWNLVTRQAFKHSLPTQTFSVANQCWNEPGDESESIGEENEYRDVSIPVRGRIQPLSFIPPFMRN
jgi:hypothetical protein